MKAVIQRVRQGSVSIGGRVEGSIGQGLLVLLGVAGEDTEEDADYIADKAVNLRIFSDENGKMNLSLKDVNGSMLVVSQFTLLADCRKGRRPSFVNAGPPEHAEKLYEYFVERVRGLGIPVETGRFGAMMEVSLVNEGPVTIVLEGAS